MDHLEDISNVPLKKHKPNLSVPKILEPKAYSKSIVLRPSQKPKIYLSEEQNLVFKTILSGMVLTSSHGRVYFLPVPLELGKVFY